MGSCVLLTRRQNRVWDVSGQIEQLQVMKEHGMRIVSTLLMLAYAGTGVLVPAGHTQEGKPETQVVAANLDTVMIVHALPFTASPQIGRAHV